MGWLALLFPTGVTGGKGAKRMDTDDLEPRPTIATPPNLDRMSVGELQEYIADLEGEIARVQAMIDAKQDHRSTAESVFKK
jgi:uncharacterized small protein (DUF1192 family)